MIARVVQFLLSLGRGPSERDLAWARVELAPGERRLFDRLSGKEKAHAIRVAKKAVGLAAKASVTSSERSALIKAALLHDIGKCGAVGSFDKIAIVLVYRFAPALADRLSEMGEQAVDPPGRKGPLNNLARAFYFDRIHPERGAELAAAAGAGRRVVELIRNHHAACPTDLLLTILSQADRGA